VLSLPDLHKKPTPASDLPPRLDGVLRFTGGGTSGGGGSGGGGGDKGGSSGSSSGWTKHQQEAVFAGGLELLAASTDCYR